MKAGKEKKGKKASSWRRSRMQHQMQLTLQWPGSSSPDAMTMDAASSQDTAVVSNIPQESNFKRPGQEESKAGISNHKRRRKSQSAGRRSSASFAASHNAPVEKKNQSQSLTSRTDPLSTEMWIDRYAPLKSVDSVVAPKKVKEIQTWLEEALIPGNSKFLILVGSPGIGKSTTVHCLAREMDLDVVEWRESVGSTWNANANVSIEYESPIRSFENFLTQNAVGYNSLVLQSSAASRKPDKSRNNSSVVLLQDLPYCHNTEAFDRLRESLTRFVRETAVPTIFIFSDVAEGKHRPDDLERLVEPNILYSQLVRIMSVPAATKARLKRCLESIAKAQGIRLTSALHDDLYLQSGGDIRHAIMTLQFDMAAGIAKKGTTSGGRDQRLSAFHALGKLLYAKRDENKKDSDKDRAPLNFDPESIVERSGMDIPRVMDFVQQNGVEFFTDVEELSDAWKSLSDAEVWMHQRLQNGSDHSSSFPRAYAASVAGRTIANYNKHPGANKFRQLGAPPAWTRQARQNFALLEHEMERLASLENARWSVETSSWAQERLSFLKIICPQESICLQSFFSEKKAVDPHDVEAEMAEKLRKEQLEILESDDIEDFPEEKEGISGSIPALELSESPKSSAALMPGDRMVH